MPTDMDRLTSRSPPRRSRCCSRRRFSPRRRLHAGRRHRRQHRDVQHRQRRAAAGPAVPRCRSDRRHQRSRAARLGGGGAIAPATFLDWRKMATSFDVMSVYRDAHLQRDADDGRAGAAARARDVDHVLRRAGRVAASSAATFTPEDAEPGRGQSIVLSYGFWQRHFAGTPDVVNQTRAAQRPALHDRRRDAGHGEFSRTRATSGCRRPTTCRAAGPDGGSARTARRALPARHRAPQGRRRRSQQANAELTTISDQLAKQYPEESSNFIGIARPLQDQLVGSARTPLAGAARRRRLRAADRGRERREPVDGARHGAGARAGDPRGDRRRSIDV